MQPMKDRRFLLYGTARFLRRRERNDGCDRLPRADCEKQCAPLEFLYVLSFLLTGDAVRRYIHSRGLLWKLNNKCI